MEMYLSRWAFSFGKKIGEEHLLIALWLTGWCRLEYQTDELFKKNVLVEFLCHSKIKDSLYLSQT